MGGKRVHAGSQNPLTKIWCIIGLTSAFPTWREVEGSYAETKTSNQMSCISNNKSVSLKFFALLFSSRKVSWAVTNWQTYAARNIKAKKSHEHVSPLYLHCFGLLQKSADSLLKMTRELIKHIPQGQIPESYFPWESWLSFPSPDTGPGHPSSHPDCTAAQHSSGLLKGYTCGRQRATMEPEICNKYTFRESSHYSKQNWLSRDFSNMQ